MKQMPVESFFVAFGRPISAAIRRTSVFAQLADRKQRARELRLGQAVQEVALVLAARRAPFSSSKRAGAASRTRA